MTKEALRAHLEKIFPPEKLLISRHDEKLNEFVAWGTLSNRDSEGTGIADRVLIAGKTFYERTASIDYLVDHASV